MRRVSVAEKTARRGTNTRTRKKSQKISMPAAGTRRRDSRRAAPGHTGALHATLPGRCLARWGSRARRIMHDGSTRIEMRPIQIPRPQEATQYFKGNK